MEVAEFTGLLHTVAFAVGYPYIITTNIDVADGLVKGAVGMRNYIATVYEHPVDDDRSSPAVRAQ
jgi:hypothetical protein